MKYVDTKVTFSEVPDEISLCISLSGCFHRCEGCHSSYLREDIGTVLEFETLDNLIKNNKGITCVCFMGGDNDIPRLCELSHRVKEKFNLRTAWYTGLDKIPMVKNIDDFDYIKVGEYKKDLGPLTSPTTNQIFYAKGRVLNKMDANPTEFYDITDKFWRK